jgi:hypothetical protein
MLGMKVVVQGKFNAMLAWRPAATSSAALQVVSSVQAFSVPAESATDTVI